MSDRMFTLAENRTLKLLTTGYVQTILGRAEISQVVSGVSDATVRIQNGSLESTGC
jgi:hypothetical protein